MPPMTQTVLIATIACYALDVLTGGALSSVLALWPLGAGFLPWQIASYALLHAGLAHLAFNMFGLWMFGSELERVWGPRRFLMYYAASVIVAGIVQLLVTAATGAIYPTVGASGGLFGLLLGYAMLFPRRTVVLLFPPIPMPAWVFAALYGLLELVLGITGAATGIAHFAHLGGMLGGWLTLRYWRGLPPFGRR